MNALPKALSTVVHMGLAAFFVFVLCLPAQSKSETTFEEVIAKFEALATAFERIAASVPRDHIDVRGAMSSAGLKTPEMVRDWMKKQTALVPYTGRLRGPLGVLDDRRGNSLDRSLLMAAMLKELGVEARLARAQLTDTQAELLLKTVGNPPPRDPSKGPTPPENLFHDLGFDQNQIAQRRAEQASEAELLKLERDFRIATHSLMIDRLVNIDSKEIDEQDYRSNVRDLKDHWWIQIKKGETWADLDPSLTAPDDAPVPLEWFKPDTVPDNMSHKVTIRIVAETIANNNPSQTTLLSKTINAESASGELIRLAFQGGGLTALLEKTKLSAASEIPALALQVRGWLPLLSIGSEIFIDKGVTTSGEIKSFDDPIFLDDTSLGSVTTKAVDNFADILGGLGEEPQVVASGALSALWIEFELTVPNTTAEIERRVIFDKYLLTEKPAEGVLLEVDWQQKRAEVLLGNIEISVQSSALSSDRSVVLISSYYSTALRQICNALRAIALKQSPKDNVKSNRYAAPPLIIYSSSRFVNQNHIYIYHPNIAIVHFTPLFVDGGNSQKITLDLIFNSIDTTLSKDRFFTRVTQGIRDTVIEDLSLGFADISKNITLQSFKYRSAGIEFNLIDSRIKEERVEKSAPEQLRGHITSGKLVITPERRLPNGEYPVWWRVDPKSGSTLGFGDYARGVSGTEYAMLTKTVIHAVLAINCAHDLQEAYEANNMCDMVKGAACFAGVALSFSSVIKAASAAEMRALETLSGARRYEFVRETLTEAQRLRFPSYTAIIEEYATVFDNASRAYTSAARANFFGALANFLPDVAGVTAWRAIGGLATMAGNNNADYCHIP
jgi:Transglutaminase-like superfamily